MAGLQKTETEILEKLGIQALNPMQLAAKEAIHAHDSVILLSPTGTGKTLAFLLPLIQDVDPQLDEVQLLIVVPSRELAIQIEQVCRDMGSGIKANAVYGGRTVSKDKIMFKHPPSILIGTPGRLTDHLGRNTFSTSHIKTLVLDEFDKSLEIGFETEMKEILMVLPQVEKKILTSATQALKFPDFVGLKNPHVENFLSGAPKGLHLKTILSPGKDKLHTLYHALCHIGEIPGIVFCNFKDSIRRVSDFLTGKGIDHGCFYGGMEQMDRELALVKFRNGTHRLLLATDLAARGLDVPEIQFILHYHLPLRAQEFTHRNGRTARMHRSGIAYVLQWEKEPLPEFIQDSEIEELSKTSPPDQTPWRTVFVSGGRRDKISKGDIAGLFFKQGKLKADDVGRIEVKQECAFVAVKKEKVKQLLKLADNQKVKKRKVRLREV